MQEVHRFEKELPAAAEPALRIVRKLTEAGHQALLAGGCARDLLLGLSPQDYDVATDATPEEICRLMRKTRKVGVQFGVVLARERGRWVEVATFRSDGEYFDGRRPCEVHFCDARRDAERRDFTVNGMFLDPTRGELIDYVGGRADLEARVIRAIGDPPARFGEDYLRLARAVRFAARLGFEIEPATLGAIRSHAHCLEEVAAERVREELERILTHATRARGLDVLVRCDLIGHLWAGADWTDEGIRGARERLGFGEGAISSRLALAWLLGGREAGEVHEICRRLTCSNEQREHAAWLIEHCGDLDDPESIELADLKRLMAHPAFEDLLIGTRGRHGGLEGGAALSARLDARVKGIPEEMVRPAPLVNGDDLAALGAAPGPIYKKVLDELYTRQLNETLRTRDEALAALDELLAGEA